MDVTKAEEWVKPLPMASEVERPFYEAAARGQLLYQECPQCKHRQFYPRAICTRCGGDPEWATASGRGTVYSFTIVRQHYAAGFRDELPYVVAMIELEEGVKMMGGLKGCAAEDVEIGMAVEAYAIEVEEGLALPFWGPAPGPSG